MNGHERAHRGEQGQGTPASARQGCRGHCSGDPGLALPVWLRRTPGFAQTGSSNGTTRTRADPGCPRPTRGFVLSEGTEALWGVSFLFVKFGESFSTRTKSASPLFTVLPAFWLRVSVKPSAHTLPPPPPTHPAGPPRRTGGLRPGPQQGGGLVSRASAVWQAKCFILLHCQCRHYAWFALTGSQASADVVAACHPTRPPPGLCALFPSTPKANFLSPLPRRPSSPPAWLSPARPKFVPLRAPCSRPLGCAADPRPWVMPWATPSATRFPTPHHRGRASLD